MGVVINPKMDAILTTLGKIKDDIKGLGFAAKGSGDIVSFPDSIGGFNVNRIVADLTPIQDLHGQDAPYPAGGGKNKLPMTVDGIKAASTTGTWSGNAYAINGITYTILVDAVNNVTGIRANGTASADAPLVMARNIALANGSYALNGCPSGGSSTKYYLYTTGVASNDYGSGASLTISGQSVTFALMVKSGTAVSNITFYPMIRLSSVTDATFAPYENICPILGHSEVLTGVNGTNLWDEAWELGYYSTSTGAPATGTSNIRTRNRIKVSPNSTIYCKTAGQIMVALFYNANDNFVTTINITDQTYTIPANCYYMRFYMGLGYGTTYNNNISVSLPSTDTSYHAYIGTSVLTEIGINQWDEIGEYGGINSSTGADTSSTTTWRSKNYIPVTQGQMIYAKTGSVAIYCRWYDANKTYLGAYDATGGHGSITNGVLTAPTNACYFRFVLDARPNDGIISINYPARFTDYYPYTDIGTVYGGTLDVTSGKLTVDRVCVSSATITQAKMASVDTVGSITRVWANLDANKKYIDGSVICSIAPPQKWVDWATETVAIGSGVDTYPSNIWMKLPTSLVGTTIASYYNYIHNNPFDIVYPLATPIVYQLEPQAVQTVLGQNNIYVDSGEVNVWYVAGLS